jgi:hypothetical protein
MWCGERYTSRPRIDFHIWMLGDKPGQNKMNPKDAARIEMAWERKTQKRETTSRLIMAITFWYLLSVICVYSERSGSQTLSLATHRTIFCWRACVG